MSIRKLSMPSSQSLQQKPTEEYIISIDHRSYEGGRATVTIARIGSSYCMGRQKKKSKAPCIIFVRVTTQ